MTVACTAKRRRRQMKLDKRYHRKDPASAARRDLMKSVGEKARAIRSKGK